MATSTATGSPKAASEQESAPPTIEVELDPTLPDAEVLADWIHETTATTLTQLTSPPTRHDTYRISLSGAIYDYQVSLTTIPEASTNETTRTWSCECTNDELLAGIHHEVEVAAHELEAATAPTPAPPRPRLRWRDLQLGGKVGMGLIAGGGAAAATGLVLIGIGRPTTYLSDFRVPGVATFAVGLGWLAAGATMVAVDRRGARQRAGLGRATPIPLVARDGVRLGLAGRF